MSVWGEQVIALSGDRCVVCGALAELDHIIPRSQDRRYRDDPRNGIPLCGGAYNGHHDAKTAGRFLFDPAWFRWDQLELLAEADWCAWNPETGEPAGRGYRHFWDMGPLTRARLIREHGGLPMLARDVPATVAEH